MAATFFWYELMTSDVPAAVAFYEAVVGWNSEAFAGSDMGYIVVKAGDTGVGGIMNLPPDAAAMGAGPAWLGYIKASDTDAEAAAIVAAGGWLHRQPEDIAGGVGRFCVAADPQGATYMLLQPNGPDQPGPAPMTPGTVGWNELYADDWQTLFPFYAGLYGWTMDQAIDMGDMGTYQLFAVDGRQNGGMMNRPPEMPACWLFYFAVEGIDAAVERIGRAGGKVLFGPQEVPGGQWIVQALDPQGAVFALVSDTK